MELVRIGQKLISRNRIIRRIDEMLQLRVAGKSQQETAAILDVDRTFVSRLEALGEVRKGGRIALVGFPVKNKAELEQAALKEGVDYVLLFTEQERREFAASGSGADLINQLMQMAAELKSYEHVIFLGSDMRIDLVEAMIGRDSVIGLQIGRSPITEDVWIDPSAIVEIVRGLRE